LTKALKPQTFEESIRDLVKGACDEAVAIAREQWSQEYVTIDEVCEWLKINRVSLHNLRKNPRKSFPKPIYFTSQPTWLRLCIIEWSINQQNEDN